MSRCKALIVLGYTADDDGIRAYCDNVPLVGEGCGFVKDLGWHPTFKEVFEAQREHDRRELS